MFAADAAQAAAASGDPATQLLADTAMAAVKVVATPSPQNVKAFVALAQQRSLSRKHLSRQLRITGGAVSANQQAAARYRQAQRAVDARRATVALRLAVRADPGFGLALADLDPLAGTMTQDADRQQMNWERHHVELVRTAAGGNAERATDLLREHLAGVGCDPLALRIVLHLLAAAGRTRLLQDLAHPPPTCHPGPWSSRS